MTTETPVQLTRIDRCRLRNDMVVRIRGELGYLPPWPWCARLARLRRDAELLALSSGRTKKEGRQEWTVWKEGRERARDKAGTRWARRALHVCRSLSDRKRDRPKLALERCWLKLAQQANWRSTRLHSLVRADRLVIEHTHTKSWVRYDYRTVPPSYSIELPRCARIVDNRWITDGYVYYRQRQGYMLVKLIDLRRPWPEDRYREWCVLKAKVLGYPPIAFKTLYSKWDPFNGCLFVNDSEGYTYYIMRDPEK